MKPPAANVMSFTITTMTTLRRPTIVQASCYTAVCTALGDRFGTRFWVQNTGGNCMTMMARLEGGIALVITDCEDTLSPVGWHWAGRAKGFYVGVYRTVPGADGVDVDWTNQFASAYSETAEPTAEAIGDLICEALKNAAINPGRGGP
jgi:hypothetical protein